MGRFSRLIVPVAAVILCEIPASAQGLQLSISVREQTIVAPNPVRAMLHFHNSGQQTFWLYRPIGNASQVTSSNPFQATANEPGPNQTSGGSTLAVHVAPVDPQAGDQGKQTGRGEVILPDGFPHPGLVRLAPGQDFNENVAIHVEPARIQAGNGERTIWGRYQFSVTYSAQYSNENELSHTLGINLWHEQVRSNNVTLDLKPPTAQGSIEGTVTGSSQRPLYLILVTLSNEDEEPLDQLRSDDQGRFSFTHLSPGRYWVAARELGATEDNTVYRHFDLSASEPQATGQMMMLPAEVHKPELLLHKPVVFRIVDGAGHPLPEVTLSIVWSTGTVTESAKAKTDKDGLRVMNLIPGRNFLTLHRHGCKRQDLRADVSPGGGVDGFSFTYDCPGQ